MILLLAVLLVLLAGIASASDVPEDTLGADTHESIATDTPAQEEVAVQKQATPTMDVQKNMVEKSSKITREEKNTKTASYDVTTYQELHDKLTSSDYELTVNIKDNITLVGNIIINPKYVTINGEANTINGANQYHFLSINTGQTVIINDLTITKCRINQETDNNYNGGAITNCGNLTINNCIFMENQATGILGSGGAITSYSNLTVTDAQFAANRAKYGGESILKRVL
ncbi:MAG: hypothetical protein Q4Q22_08150 [Methanosphaera sp.]|nr:hypothetical protein [Methanosphaera sp.]